MTGCFAPLDYATGNPKLPGGQGARPAVDEITKEQRTNQRNASLMEKVSLYKQSAPEHVVKGSILPRKRGLAVDSGLDKDQVPTHKGPFTFKNRSDRS